MRIATKLRGVCPDTETCPAVHLSDRRTLVVQGYPAEVGEVGLAPGEIAVEVPLSLLPELASRQPRDDFWLTDLGTVIVTGPEVVDADALSDLRLPADESAVEVELVLVPEIGGVDAGSR